MKNIDEARKIIKYLKNRKSEIIYNELARQQFNSKCQEVFDFIVQSVHKMAKMCINLTVSTPYYFAFKIDNCGHAELFIYDKNGISYLFSPFDKTHSENLVKIDLKKSPYLGFEYTSNFSEFSLQMFEENLNHLELMQNAILKFSKNK